MIASVAKISANQANAQKSTGPTSLEGKATVASNAQTHGLFTKRLVLEDEDPAEFQILVEQLTRDLRPIGMLEQAMVERIATSLWRQKRLIRAESASLELHQQPHKMTNEISLEFPHYLRNDLTTDDLVEFDQGQLNWCQATQKECQGLNVDFMTDLDYLQQQAPLIYKQLCHDAEEVDMPPKRYLQQCPPSEYLSDLNHYCRDQIQRAWQRPVVLKLATLVRNKRAVLPNDAFAKFGKYQVMLDNELYKAIKALREAQDWRLKTLPVTNDDGFVLETLAN